MTKATTNIVKRCDNVPQKLRFSPNTGFAIRPSPPILMRWPWPNRPLPRPYAWLPLHGHRTFPLHRGGNPVSVHHSEIRCRFIILARKDELTPNYAKRRTDTGLRRHRITPPQGRVLTVSWAAEAPKADLPGIQRARPSDRGGEGDGSGVSLPDRPPTELTKSVIFANRRFRHQTACFRTGTTDQIPDACAGVQPSDRLFHTPRRADCESSPHGIESC